MWKYNCKGKLNIETRRKLGNGNVGGTLGNCESGGTSGSDPAEGNRWGR